MPEYEYRDPNDGETISFRFPIGEAPEEFELAEDNGEVSTYRRVYTANAVHFRGSGWASKDK